MSDDDLDIVRRMWVAYRTGGVEASLALCAPDVVFVSASGARFDGHDGIRAFFADFARRDQRFTAAPFTFEPVGDGVLVAGHRRIAGDDGAVAEHLHFTHRVRDGLITELAAYGDRTTALAALGGR